MYTGDSNVTEHFPNICFRTLDLTIAHPHAILPELTKIMITLHMNILTDVPTNGV